jgi:hypothetical protein
MSDSSDDQAGAEQFDEEITGPDDRLIGDEVHTDFPPHHLHGVPFADADVTDESLEERLEQEEPDPSTEV